ncbi:MAG: helix-hairpin-helix domain-containing protein [Chlorobia bacterium]|nr:helix-hairpin-helix domain-containing protein [Fimbriimonadaceae bacterium]
MPFKEKATYLAIGVLAIGGITYVGATNIKSPSKITFENLPPKTEETKPAKPSSLVVHVSGAVRKPGVYRLKPDGRVHDAIREAGGAKPHADLTDWNLAARVQDGAPIHIAAKTAKVESKSSTPQRTRPRPLGGIPPLRIDVPEEYRGGPGALALSGKIKVEPESGGKRPSTGKKPSPAEGSISLNTASSAQLQQLPGVGPSTAEKILDYRKEHGGFTSIDEVLAVKGIGPKKLESMRRFLRL